MNCQFERIAAETIRCSRCSYQRRWTDASRLPRQMCAAILHPQALVPAKGKCCGGAAANPKSEIRNPKSEPALPGLLTMAGNLAGAVGRVTREAVHGRLVWLDQATADARFAICRTCDEYRPSDGRCAVCGCAARAKGRLATEECPHPDGSKWPAQQSPIGNRQSAILFRFPHGIGDHVQLATVLRHVAARRPDLAVDVEAHTNCHGLLRDYCRAVYPLGRRERRDESREPEASGARLSALDSPPYALVRHLSFADSPISFADSPSTKADRCLRELFGLTPEPAYWGYQLTPSPEAHAAADSVLAALGLERSDESRVPVRSGSGLSALDSPPAGSVPAILVHYQGISVRRHKNLPQFPVELAIAVARNAGVRTLLIDYENRAGKLRDWPGVTLLPKLPDVETFGALAQRCVGMVGIDSGPAKVAQAVGCRTVVVWTGNHPLHFDPPMAGTLHLVPDHHANLIRPPAAAGLEFFTAQYNHRVYRRLGEALPAAVREWILRPGGAA